MALVTGLFGVLGAGTSGAATLAGGIAAASGTTVAVVPMGHLNDSENRFFQTFALTPSGAWSLTTPTGVASNGGIVLASPTASAAAVLPWYLLRFTAVRPLMAGRAAGPGQVLPPLSATPTALSAAPNGEIAFVTSRGVVMTGTSIRGPFRAVTSLSSLSRTAPGHRCGVATLTSVVAGDRGVVAVGGTCRRPGADGIFTRDSSGWRVGTSNERFPVSVVRLDATATGSIDGMLSVGGGQPLIVAGQVTAGGIRLGGLVQQPSSGLRSTEFLAAHSGTAPEYVVSAVAGKGIRATLLPVSGTSRALGPMLPRSVQAVVSTSSPSSAFGSDSTTAFVVEGSFLRELTLTSAGTRWVVAGSLHVAVPYGTSK